MSKKEWTQQETQKYFAQICIECLARYRYCEPQCTNCKNDSSWRKPLHGKTHTWSDGVAYICRYCNGTGSKTGSQYFCN